MLKSNGIPFSQLFIIFGTSTRAKSISFTVSAFAGNLNTSRFPQLEIKNASSKMDRSTSREARRAYMRSSVLLFRSSTSSASSFSVDSIIVTKERDGCVFCVRN